MEYWNAIGPFTSKFSITRSFISRRSPTSDVLILVMRASVLFYDATKLSKRCSNKRAMTKIQRPSKTPRATAGTKPSVSKTPATHPAPRPRPPSAVFTKMVGSRGRIPARIYVFRSIGWMMDWVVLVVLVRLQLQRSPSRALCSYFPFSHLPIFVRREFVSRYRIYIIRDASDSDI